DDPGDLSKGREGHEDRIRHREIIAGEGFGGSDGERCFRGVPGRRGCQAGRRAARGVSQGRDYGGWRFFRTVGKGNCAARGRKSAEAGATAGSASNGISAARVAGAAKDSARQHADVYASGTGAGEPEVGAGGGEGLRDKSCFDCGAMPSRHPRGRQSGGVPVGSVAGGTIVGGGTVGGLSEGGSDREPRAGKTRGYWRGLTCVAFFGQSGLNLDS